MSLGRPRISIIPADAVTDSSLEGRDLQVLALLGRHTDNRGWCCRSQVKMAKELGCGRATVQRSITRLVSAGYLQLRVKVRDSGADAAHEYRVVLDRPDFDEAVETDADAAAATEG
ncbi:MAG: MarR family transcriptional regulator, partial [Mesorhizobium sp.]